MHKAKLFRLCLLALLSMLFASPDADGQEVFQRKIDNIAFVPKGQYITGVSVNYAQSSQDNYQFLVFEKINGENYSFKVSPMLFYTFKDNLAAGGRFAYSRHRTHLNSADVVLDSETSYDIENLYSISHSYEGMAAFRMYMSLGKNTRFGLFNEVQLQVGGGQSKICSGSGTSLTGTYERSFKCNVGLAPGVVVFLNNYSAMEVNVGVLGFDYNHTRSVSDQVYVAHRKTKQANFKINLFSITFGVAFYI